MLSVSTVSYTHLDVYKRQINTSAATLTTGNPIITDGKISGYDVKQGTVTVSGQGLDASRTSRTDILAEAVQLNGKVWSDAVSYTHLM